MKPELKPIADKIEDAVVISSSPTVSPKKKNKKTLFFLDAMQEVINDKKIHKLEWEDKEYYGFRHNEKLSLHKPDGKTYQWILSDGDMLGDDYIVLE